MKRIPYPTFGLIEKGLSGGINVASSISVVDFWYNFSLSETGAWSQVLRRVIEQTYLRIGLPFNWFFLGNILLGCCVRMFAGRVD